MKIISWNVNGVRAIAKKDFGEQFKILNPDVLCLQETKATVAQTQEVIGEIAPDYHFFGNEAERKGYSGTAIISKEAPTTVEYGIGVEEHDQEGRVITAEYDTFYLVTAYVPNSGSGLVRLEYRQQWDTDFLKYCKNLESKKPVVICGDLNVAHQAIDLKNPKNNYNKSAGYTQKEIDGLEAFMNEGFVDTWRSQHPDEVKYSWWSYRFSARQKNIGWRIDYFLTSKVLIDKLQSTAILNDFTGSDHCPVQIEIE